MSKREIDQALATSEVLVGQRRWLHPWACSLNLDTISLPSAGHMIDEGMGPRLVLLLASRLGINYKACGCFC